MDHSFGHSVAYSFPIATVRDTEETQVLVDLAPFLVSDWADVGSTLQAAATRRKLVAAVTLDDKRSSLQELRLFPTNLEAEVRLTFQTPRNLGLETGAARAASSERRSGSTGSRPPSPARGCEESER